MYENKSYEELLEELKSTEMQLSVVTSAKFDRTTEAKVQGEMDKKGEYVKAGAKRYGQDVDRANAALSSYEDGLEAVRDEFALEKEALLIENANLNQIELEGYAEARSIQLELRNTELTDEERQNKEMQLKESRAEIDATALGSNEMLDGVDATAIEFDNFFDDMVEEKGLVEAEKKGPLAELFSKLTSRVNGKKKFETEVIGSLESKADDIKENKVAEAREKVEGNLADKIKDVYEKVKERAKEIGDKVTDKLAELNITKEKMMTLLLIAKTAGAALGVYSVVKLGLDYGITAAVAIKDRLASRNYSGPALA